MKTTATPRNQHQNPQGGINIGYSTVNEKFYVLFINQS